MKQGMQRTRINTSSTARPPLSQQRQSNHRAYQSSSNYYMYSANAVARDYVQHAPTEQQEYEKHRQNQERAKARMQGQRKQVKILLSSVHVLGIIFLLAMLLVVQYTWIQNMGYELSQTKAELKAVLDDNEKLKQQIAMRSELTAVEAVAISSMGMHKPADSEIIYLPALEKRAEETATEQGE